MEVLASIETKSDEIDVSNLGWQLLEEAKAEAF